MTKFDNIYKLIMEGRYPKSTRNIMSNNAVAKKLDFAFNHYDHCGEFDFYGNKIVVFRRCGYEDYESGKYYDGDEAVAAFVNDEYIAGWYEQDSNDLEYVMNDAIDWIFENKPVEIEYKVFGNVKEGTLEERRGIKYNILESMKKIVKEICGDEYISSVNILSVEKDNFYNSYNFIATFKGGKIPFEILRKKYDLSDFTNDTCIDDGEVEFANETDKELYESMFTYKQSWL